MKVDVKVEVLSMRFQDWWRISKINNRVCHGKLRGQDISKEQNWSLSIPRKGHHLNPPENEVIKSDRSRFIPSQGGWL